MRVKLQLVMCSDEGQEETVTNVITLNKNSQRIEHLGLTLAEAKQLLSTLQRHLLQQQVDTFLDPCSTCPDCGALLKVKAHASRSFRTLFGTCKLDSPRLEHCDCKRRKTLSFRPLSALLTESVAPELLYEVLHSQGLQMNQEITFLADGNDTLRELQLEMSPKATHIVDWFHLTMKLTVLEQYGKGLVQCEAALGEKIREKIARLQWSLWHGQVDKALSKIDDLASSIASFNETYARFNRLVKALSAWRTYIVHNQHLVPNYGQRYHHGEAIATGFVESTVNQVVSKRFCKKQQMQWSKPGAHLLLQTRVKTLDGELGAIFKRWYPDMDLEVEEMPAAA